MTDEEFMAKILSVADYVEENGMSPNNTIRAIAYNALTLLAIATLDQYEEDVE